MKLQGWGDFSVAGTPVVVLKQSAECITVINLATVKAKSLLMSGVEAFEICSVLYRWSWIWSVLRWL